MDIDFLVTRACSPLLWPQDTEEMIPLYTQLAIYYVYSGHGNRLLTIQNNCTWRHFIWAFWLDRTKTDSRTKMHKKNRIKMQWCDPRIRTHNCLHGVYVPVFIFPPVLNYLKGNYIHDLFMTFPKQIESDLAYIPEQQYLVPIKMYSDCETWELLYHCK